MLTWSLPTPPLPCHNCNFNWLINAMESPSSWADILGDFSDNFVGSFTRGDMIAIVGVLERIRKKLFLFLLFLSCIIFLHRFSRFKDETEVDVNSKTFLFENCSCNRTVFDIEENKTNSVKFSQTTCGREAFEKGSNQKASLSTGTVHLKLTRLENISLGSRRTSVWWDFCMVMTGAWDSTTTWTR